MTCDQAVGRLLGRSAPRYRQTLLQMARLLLERPAAHGSLAFMRRRSQIVQRLECLRPSASARPAWRRAATGATVGLLLVCFVPLARPALRPDTTIATALTADPPGCLQQRFRFFQLLAQEEAHAPRRLLAGAP
jgi:hypothetical protein